MKTTGKEKSKRGGKRVGAGRPKLLSQEKKPVRITFEEELLINKIRSNGNIQEMLDLNTALFLERMNKSYS